MWPDLRIEHDGKHPMAVGYHQRRLLRSRTKHLRAALVCRAKGHDWSPWTLDDMEGPVETIQGADGDLHSMPLCCRESREGEYGHRVCRRSCGANESRWPLAEAPSGWQERLGV